mgnify:CR=1 FL=1
MKKHRIFLLKTNALFLKNLIRFLGLIGFGVLFSCNKINNNPIAMYGVISPDINFRGKIISEETQNPIPGISVKLTSGYYDTVYAVTDQAGNYSAWKFATENENVKMILTDADSTLNGEFENKTLTVVVSFRDYNNKEHEENVALHPKP